MGSSTLILNNAAYQALGHLQSGQQQHCLQIGIGLDLMAQSVSLQRDLFKRQYCIRRANSAGMQQASKHSHWSWCGDQDVVHAKYLV